MRKYSNHWAMESIKFMKCSSIDRGASQGKSSVVNGYFRVMCEVKWTLSWGNKVGKRAVKNPFIYP